MHDAPYNRITALRSIDLGRAAIPYEFWQERARFGYVYLLGELNNAAEPTEWVKIGHATDPVRRIRSLQTGNPRPLQYEALILGDKRTERLLHKHFAGVAVGNSEWHGHGYREAIIAFFREISRRQMHVAADPTEWVNDGVLRETIVLEVLAG